MESPEITKNSYNWIRTNNNLFNIVFTHNKNLLDMVENFKFCPTGGCWIKPNDQKIYSKNKILSIISSGKNVTFGHRLRNNIVNIFKNNMDVYGRKYNPIEYKLSGLKDYAFSIVVENAKEDYYFTEKIIDCFMTGTIPIYWGCPSIGDFFNIDGILTFDTIDELNNIINNLSLEYYNNKIESIKYNYEIAKKYLIAEDFIYENYSDILFQ